MDPLKCEKSVRRQLGKNNHGVMEYVSEKCGAPASEVEVGGTLAKARAVLCVKHKQMADQELFTSTKGYPYGRAEKNKKTGDKFPQERLPGTWVIG